MSEKYALIALVILVIAFAAGGFYLLTQQRAAQERVSTGQRIGGGIGDLVGGIVDAVV